MLYPIYVHKEDDSAYGAAFPDIPGCFAGADDIQALPQAAQEAVEAHFGTDEDPIPAASAPDVWANDPDYQDGGFWMLVDIDLTRIRARAVRLNISLPENLVLRIDATARQRGQSRSAFLATAAEREMAEA
ncbi:type II toxin-antitoxin system HicB family antitoxin [Pusillimonas sp. SM2304]|uniref:type II toxin-antitoxin system HicB family antitoxin n=1 Tax=Pusillimonas sp. SM2304 TaxID=3073241 RepID=UPI002874B861|nr:type II toxin-antitoxin system HicB family antitoxin [Pusillimonas sp. SM2304]MDS1140295.1 type II toxin-antitoxin system HicB family antitoxin [Pusillimonas sp. SM2304]